MAWWVILLIALGTGSVGFWFGARTSIRAIPKILAGLRPEQLALLAKQVAKERGGRDAPDV